MSISQPVQVTVPFATSGLKNAIPATTNNVTGNAGYSAGFGSINMTPISAGGIPPFGQDFNGIFFEMSTAQQYTQAGGLYVYSSAFSTAIGGYPQGAILSNSSRTGIWINQIANNTTNPDTGGAGWLPVTLGNSFGRLIGAPKTFFTPGVTAYVPTPGMQFVIAFAVGAGGGGGGTLATGASQVAIGAGGASGSFWNGVITSAQVGASLSITIGSGGAGTSGATGGSGGATSIGPYVTIPGGLGGTAGGVISNTITALSLPGSPGGPPSANTVTTITQGNGISGSPGIATPSGVISGGGGGSPIAGASGAGRPVVAGNAGVNATAPGAGGSGSAQGASAAALSGGSAASAMVIIYEYGNSL